MRRRKKGTEVLVFKALADETRLRILELIAQKELCACEILEHFEITQPTLSYHMKILAECELVAVRKDGAWVRYTLNRKQIGKAGQFLDKLAG